MLKKISLAFVIIILFISAANIYAYSSPDDITQEIISLELSLSSNQKKLDDLNKDIEIISGQIEELKSEEKEIDKNITTSRNKLRYWYRFLYTDGNISLLEAILNSRDIPDLFSRIYYIESIQEYYLSHLKQLNTLKEDKEKLSSELALRQKDLESVRDDLESTIENIQRLISVKQKLYQMALTDENIRMQIEQGESLLQRFEVLNYLITHLSDLPWESIEPSSVKVNPLFSGASATIDEKAIDDVIHSDENLKDVSLHITRNGFVIEGPSSDRLSRFTMEGGIRLSDNNTINFIPGRLTLDSVTIENEGLENILNSSELNLTLPPLPFNLKVESLELNDGYITLDLTR
ncbi:MAG: hypothetical protein QME46_03985 [Thermoanaerobacteraceae bacterium]|nr:hypothetical protein [Thermoanaerobacteraceae bacterium]